MKPLDDMAEESTLSESIDIRFGCGPGQLLLDNGNGNSESSMTSTAALCCGTDGSCGSSPCLAILMSLTRFDVSENPVFEVGGEAS